MRNTIFAGHMLLLILVVLAAGVAPADAQHHSHPKRKSPQRRGAAQQKAARYACPMHPEVVAKSPGICPKCNMKLRVASAPLAGKAPVAPGPADDKGNNTPPTALRIPDTIVYDQHGQRLNFYSDLVKGKTVAINYIFTTCTGVCPTLTTKFRRLQEELGERVGRDVQLISISVDPTTDVPERLRDYAAKFKAGPGWTFVTGGKPEIDQLLGALGAYATNFSDHPQLILIGNEAAGYWTRVPGLAQTAIVSQAVLEAANKGGTVAHGDGQEEHTVSLPFPTAHSDGGAPPERRVERRASIAPPTARPRESERAATAVQPGDLSDKTTQAPAGAAASYFPNIVLLTQDNKPVRFYDDLLKGKVVLVNFIFTTCKGVCPPMTANLAKVQQYLGERVGREVSMISLSVDPTTDTPEALQKYARSYKAKPGWYFLTGSKENVEWVLYKMGGYTEDKATHSSVLIIGNEATGVWQKVPAMADPALISSAVIELLKPAAAQLGDKK